MYGKRFIWLVKYLFIIKTEDVKEIAKLLSELPKKNAQRPRVVVITQGSDPIVLSIGMRFNLFIFDI